MNIDAMTTEELIETCTHFREKVGCYAGGRHDHNEDHRCFPTTGGRPPFPQGKRLDNSEKETLHPEVPKIVARTKEAGRRVRPASFVASFARLSTAASVRVSNWLSSFGRASFVGLGRGDTSSGGFLRGRASSFLRSPGIGTLKHKLR